MQEDVVADPEGAASSSRHRVSGGNKDRDSTASWTSEWEDEHVYTNDWLPRGASFSSLPRPHHLLFGRLPERDRGLCTIERSQSLCIKSNLLAQQVPAGQARNKRRILQRDISGRRIRLVCSFCECLETAQSIPDGQASSEQASRASLRAIRRSIKEKAVWCDSHS